MRPGSATATRSIRLVCSFSAMTADRFPLVPTAQRRRIVRKLANQGRGRVWSGRVLQLVMELRINRILAMLLDKDNAQEANTAASQLITELQKNYRYGDVAFIENKEDKDEKCVRFLCLLVDKEREIEMLKAQKLHLLNRSAQEEPKRPSRTKYQRLTRTKPVTAEDIAAL